MIAALSILLFASLVGWFATAVVLKAKARHERSMRTVNRDMWGQALERESETNNKLCAASTRIDQLEQMLHRWKRLHSEVKRRAKRAEEKLGREKIARHILGGLAEVTWENLNRANGALCELEERP